MDFSPLYATQALLLGALPETRRFLHRRINWDNRLICLYGGRGVGKTTLMLQRLREVLASGGKGLYFSADHVQVAATGIYEIASEFFRHGGEAVFIDEAHKRPEWAQEVKSLYDSFPRARLVLSGSSTLALQTGKIDLSRRAVYLELPVLSFREYLAIATGLTLEPLTLDDLLPGHTRVASDILAHGPILGHFRDYLERGAYPFFTEGLGEYLQRLENVIEKTLYEDAATTDGRRASGITAMKKLLWLVATSPPMSFNATSVSRDLGVSRPTIYTYLEALERSGLLLTIPPAGDGARLARKDSKLFLANTNFLWAISQTLTANDPRGTMRETFFANQTRAAGLRVRGADKGDFVLNERVTVEIGGKNKTAAQVAAVPDAYVARDGQEVGSGRTIPLWLFGFLY